MYSCTISHMQAKSKPSHKSNHFYQIVLKKYEENIEK